LTKLRNNLDYKIVEPDAYQIYQEWYHVIIRELVCMSNFKGDFDSLAKMVSPSITPGKAKKSVELLMNLGFIQQNPNGSYFQKDPVLYTGPNIKDHAVVEYQIKMFKLALQSFEKAIPGEFLASSTTLGISLQKLGVYKKIIRACRMQLLELAKSDESPNSVYQVNINMFKMSK